MGKRLLNALNSNNEPNILYMQGQGGGGKIYNGGQGINVDNDNDIISIQNTYFDKWNDYENQITDKLDTTAFSTVSSNFASTTQIYYLSENLDELSGSVNSITGQINSIDDRLDVIDTTIETITGNIDTLSSDISTINGNIDSINNTLNNTVIPAIETISDIQDNISNLNEEVSGINQTLENVLTTDSIGLQEGNVVSSITLPNGITATLKDEGIRHIYLEDEEEPLPYDYDYNVTLPYATAEYDISADIFSGTPGIMSIDDKFKLDNIDLVGIRNPDTFSGMQLTYVGSPDSGTNTFLGYINDVNRGNLGFYDLTGYSLDEALADTTIITNSANWVEHPFGLSPEMFNTLSTLYNLLSDSANHPNAMLGMTAGNFGWIDIN